jgi:hypothetical protein
VDPNPEDVARAAAEDAIPRNPEDAELEKSLLAYERMLRKMGSAELGGTGHMVRYQYDLLPSYRTWKDAWTQHYGEPPDTEEFDKYFASETAAEEKEKGKSQLWHVLDFSPIGQAVGAVRDIAAGETGIGEGPLKTVGGVLSLSPGLRPLGEGIKAFADKDPEKTMAVRAGQLMGTLQRPIAAVARAYEEERAASAADFAELSGRPKPVNPETQEPYRHRTLAEHAVEVLESAVPIPQTKRSDVSFADVLRAKSVADGGSGNEWWVLAGGLLGDVVVDPANLFGVTVPTKVTRLTRLGRLSPMMKGILDDLGPELQEAIGRGELERGNRLVAAALDQVQEDTRKAAVLRSAATTATKKTRKKGKAAIRPVGTPGPPVQPPVVGEQVMSPAMAAMRQADMFSNTTGIARRIEMGIRTEMDRAFTRGEQQVWEPLEDVAGGLADLQRTLEQKALLVEDKAASEGILGLAKKAEFGAARIRALARRVDDPYLVLEVPLAKTILRKPIQWDLIDSHLTGELGDELVKSEHSNLSKAAGSLWRGLSNAPAPGTSLTYRMTAKLAAQVRQDAQRANYEVQRHIGDIDNIGRTLEDYDKITATIEKPWDHAAQVEWDGAFGNKELRARGGGPPISYDDEKRMIWRAKDARVSATVAAESEDEVEALWLNDGLPAILEAAPLEDVESMQRSLARVRDLIIRRMQGATYDVLKTMGKAADKVESEAIDAADKIARRIIAAEARSHKLVQRGVKTKPPLSDDVVKTVEIVGKASQKQQAILEAAGRKVDRMMTTLEERLVKGATGQKAAVVSRAAARQELKLESVLGLFERGLANIRKDYVDYQDGISKLDVGLQRIRADAISDFQLMQAQRKAMGISNSELEAFFPHIYRDGEMIWKAFDPYAQVDLMGETVTRDPLLRRKVGSIQEGKKLGLDPITHTLHAWSAERYAHQMLVSKYKLKEEVLQKWGHLKGEREMHDASRYHPVNHMGKEYVVPKDVADALVHIENMWNPKRLSEWQQVALRTLDAVTNIWKTKATVGKIGYHTRNFWSDAYMMWAGGWTGRNMGRALTTLLVGAQEREVAQRAVRGMHNPEKIGLRDNLSDAALEASSWIRKKELAGLDRMGRFVKRSKENLWSVVGAKAKDGWQAPDKKRWSPAEMYEAASREGIVDTSISYLDIDRAGAKRAFEGKPYKLWRFYTQNMAALNPLGSKHLILRAFDNGGRARESHFRLTYFMDRILSHGDSPEEAARMVRRYMYDYGDKSKVDRIARRFIPFYMWMRKNLPRQMDNVIRNPSVASVPFKIKRAFDKQHQAAVDGRVRAHQRDWPMFLRQKMAMHSPFKYWPVSPEDLKLGRGDEEDNLVLYNPDMPPTDLNMLDLDDADTFMSMLHPIPKLLIEMGMGKPLSERSGSFAPRAVPGYIQRAVPEEGWQALHRLFPAYVNKTVNPEAPEAGGVWRIPDQLFWALKVLQPDTMQWEQFITPAVDADERLNQTLRTLSEFTGLLRFRMFNPERQVSMKMREALEIGREAGRQARKTGTVVSDEEE